MATDTMNGTYAHQNGQSYASEHNFESHSANQSVSASNEYTSGASSTSKPDVPKDEVGWYFVEQYYTNLSKSPEKLFLFYNKQSQFVSGAEAEKVSVCVGQKAINERIKDLDFQDCKVRVTNVDSQGSRSNIVIQVIGEISNKAQPTRKFTQTFVLAEQANGYFVLNDIFRYFVEDEDYETVEETGNDRTNEAGSGHQEPAAAIEESKPQTLSSSADPIAQEQGAQTVDRSLEAAKDESGGIEPTVNGHGALADEPAIPNDSTTAAGPTSVETSTQGPASVQETATPIEAVAPEKPVDPEPTPAPASPKAAPVQAQAPLAPAPAKPSGPKSWANIAGGSQAARSAAAAVATPAPAPAAAKAAPTPAPAEASVFPSTPAAFVAPAPEPERVGTPGSSSEWQSVGHEHNKKQSRAQQGVQPPPAENSRGYIKGVTENIDEAALKRALSTVCVPSYIDISRQKNCAFVDFSSPADYRAAVQGNPYEVMGVRLFVEERKIRPLTGPGSLPNRNNGRGGRGGQFNNQGQGRGGSAPRDGAQRGSFTGGRGGRGGANFRGRGGAGQSA